MQSGRSLRMIVPRSIGFAAITPKPFPAESTTLNIASSSSIAGPVALSTTPNSSAVYPSAIDGRAFGERSDIAVGMKECVFKIGNNTSIYIQFDPLTTMRYYCQCCETESVICPC